MAMGEALWDARARVSQERGKSSRHILQQKHELVPHSKILTYFRRTEGNSAFSNSSLKLPQSCFYYIIRHSVVFTSPF